MPSLGAVLQVGVVGKKSTVDRVTVRSKNLTFIPHFFSTSMAPRLVGLVELGIIVVALGVASLSGMLEGVSFLSV